jgi:radical SAM-linked protein
VVVPPPPIPLQSPQRAPASERLQRLRFRFSKTGSLVLLSHLDLVRLMERALRRSGLPVSFTGGFHPLPRVQFGLALPLGAEAEGEWMDVELALPLTAEAARAALQEQLPEGFQLQTVAEVPVAGLSLSQEIVASHWLLVLQPSEGRVVSLEAWRDAAAALLGAASWIWEDTDKKGRPRQRDCRPFLLHLALEEGPDPRRGGAVRLALQARIDPQGRSLRPEFLRQWLAESLATPLALGRFERRALLLAAC